MNATQFIQRARKKLLKLKDQVQDQGREEENRAKILLTEGLILGPGRQVLEAAILLETRTNSK